MSGRNPIVLFMIALFAGMTGAAAAQQNPGAGRPGVRLAAPLESPPQQKKFSPSDIEPELPPPRPVEAPRPPLALSDVLASVERHYPLLHAAFQERAITAGQTITAFGAFDLRTRVQGFNNLGTFDNRRLDAVLEQPTPFGGISLFGGYRFGFGEFPVYYGNRKTAEGGEFRGGVQIPLLQGREIDRPRASILQATLNREIAEPAIERQRLDFYRAASRVYWKWLAAGQRVTLARALLSIAQTRAEQLKVLVNKGQLPPLALIDNERLIVDRQTRLVIAERRFQEAAIDLSLFVRGPGGQPLLPGLDMLPEWFPEPVRPNAAGLLEDIALALNLRPELRRLRLQRERAAVDLRLAENQFLPTLNMLLTGAQDVGEGKKEPGKFALNRAEYEAALVFEVPLQRRDASGRIVTARANLAQLAAQEQFAADRIAADVADAVSALERAFALISETERNVELARQLTRAELKLLEAGQSNLLLVNLRELAVFDAELLRVDAFLEYYQGLADYRAALGLDAHPEEFTPPLP